MVRQISYLVLTDLVGSTSYTRKLGNDAGQARVAAFERAIRTALANAKPSNSGLVVKTTGDSVLLLFSHFPDIVQWHLECLGTLHLDAIPGTEPKEARTWVHVGEVDREERDVHGLAVSELFTVEKLMKARATPGELIITGTACAIARPALYPKQCSLNNWGNARLDADTEVDLFSLAVTGDIAFLIDKQRRDRVQPQSAKHPFYSSEPAKIRELKH
jgi:class 3 adenylate cyclase